MSKSVIRTKEPMNNKALKKEAHKAGYKYIGYSKCEACEAEAANIVRTYVDAVNVNAVHKKLTINNVRLRPWINTHCALKFKKTGSIVVACRCGWRKNITIKFTPKEKRICATKDCNVILTKYDPNDKCFKCRKAQEIAPKYSTNTQVADTVKTCNRKSCNNPVPEGRSAVCYECQPPAAKFAM